jgi:hypothetical protein
MSDIHCSSATAALSTHQLHDASSTALVAAQQPLNYDILLVFITSAWTTRKQHSQSSSVAVSMTVVAIAQQWLSFSTKNVHHTAPSLWIFVVKSLQVCHNFFYPQGVLLT